MLKIAAITLCIVFLFGGEIYAKRAVPKYVPPVATNKYKVESSIAGDKGRYDCGVIVVYDNKTGEFLWWMKVYDIHYIDGLESDVQDIHISEMKVKDEILTVTNEGGMVFTVNLENKKVILHKDNIKLRNRVTVSGKWGVKRGLSLNPI